MKWARAGLLVLAGLLLWTAAPAAAEGAFIVYQCGANLCRIQPDGSGQAMLTSDGRPEGPFYASPSLSRDGARLAYNFANKTYVGGGDPSQRGAPVAQAATLATLRPDGGWLATVETFPEQTMVSGINGPTFFTTFTPFIVTYNLATNERKMTSRRPGAVAWAGDRIISTGKPTPTKRQTLCVLGPDHVSCERQVAADNDRDLTDPAVSPDNTLLAVAGCAQAERKACHLVVYALASGARVRDLTAGPDDTSPVWSPDASSIVFTRGGDLFVIASGGSPGSERVLVHGGRNATWGGTAAGPAEPPQAAEPTPSPAPEPAPAIPDASLPGGSGAEAVQLAVATAADQLQVPPEDLVVVRVEPTEWSDASIGCPEPDRAYAQVITPGYLVVVATADGSTELQIHTDQAQLAVVC